jgi:hypothetical protein
VYQYPVASLPQRCVDLKNALEMIVRFSTISRTLIDIYFELWTSKWYYQLEEVKDSRNLFPKIISEAQQFSPDALEYGI